MEDLEKQIFDETQRRQARLAKKMMLGILGGTGLVFAVLGIVLACVGVAVVPIVFMSVGLFLIVLGAILYFVIPERYDYDKYKNNAKKYGILNQYEMSAKIIELEARIEALEQDDEI